jgi:hypothetical protein
MQMNLFGKIEERKFSVHLISLFVVDPSRERFIAGIAKVLVLAVNHYVGHPHVLSLGKRDTLVTGRVRRVFSLISSVLRVGGDSKITLPIVKSDMRDVVAYERQADPQYFRSHRNPHPLSFHRFSANSVKSLVGVRPLRSPRMLGDAHEVIGVDEGNLSLGQRNFTIGWEEWKGHGRSLGGWACPVRSTPDPSILSGGLI